MGASTPVTDDIDEQREQLRLEVVEFFEKCEARDMAIDDRVGELADLVQVGKVTVYRWRTGRRPLRVVMPALRTALREMRSKYDIS